VYGVKSTIKRTKYVQICLSVFQLEKTNSSASTDKSVNSHYGRQEVETYDIILAEWIFHSSTRCSSCACENLSHDITARKRWPWQHETGTLKLPGCLKIYSPLMFINVCSAINISPLSSSTPSLWWSPRDNDDENSCNSESTLSVAFPNRRRRSWWRWEWWSFVVERRHHEKMYYSSIQLERLRSCANYLAIITTYLLLRSLARNFRRAKMLLTKRSIQETQWHAPNERRTRWFILVVSGKHRSRLLAIFFFSGNRAEHEYERRPTKNSPARGDVRTLVSNLVVTGSKSSPDEV